MDSHPESIEDLYIYQKAREFSGRIKELAESLPVQEKSRLQKEMMSAKLSLTNGLAEGYGLHETKENIQCCRKARGSLFMLIDDLNECFESGHVDRQTLDSYKTEAYNLLKALNAYILSIRENKVRTGL